MTERDWKRSYLSLSPKAALRELEEPFIYLFARDELYEVNDEAFEFLRRCDGTRLGQDLAGDEDFVDYCLSEGILEAHSNPSPCRIMAARSPVLSLRYLELQLTARCNLRCLHCYQGRTAGVDLPLESALRITREFGEMGGIRLLASGGEPMLYPRLAEFLDGTQDVAVRRILITNGTLIDETNVAVLAVDEVQFSLDGWERGHELIRGKGTFKKVMRGIDAVNEAGLSVSIATMIHRGNRDEFDQMALFIERIGAVGWGVDLPCVTGRLDVNREMTLPPTEAAPLLGYAFGGGSHAARGFTCGHHLMTVLPTGIGARCGFYADDPLGNAGRSLGDCWLSVKHTRAEELECRGCLRLDECGGGCRFRAPGPSCPIR